ncbi:hypothetical protein EVJ58_g1955 [Rhodofomes roseus]|uniref:Uncharacterized protein n=1 Tax=Rhodofomes roseus TaxID=34475 RepID=A0A4Y9YV94_9APHY|nr:hypothetical protein EVJ58_g1955 [Rhodofomes roseus]
MSDQHGHDNSDSEESERFYCGCLSCKRKGQSWRSRTTWYKHKSQRELQIREGHILPADPSHAVPTQSRRTKRTRRDNQSAVNSNKRPRIDTAAGEEGHEMDASTSVGGSQTAGESSSVASRPPPDSELERETLHGEQSPNHTSASSPAQPDDVVPNMQPDGVIPNVQPDGVIPNMQPDGVVPNAQPDGVVPDVQSDGGVEPAAGPSLPLRSRIPIIDNALQFIHGLRSSPSIANEKLDDETKQRLHSPPTEIPTLTADERLCIRLFLADTDGSEKIYTETCAAIKERFPESELLSHHLVKKKVAELTGVVSILEDMCPNSCLAYTGPFKDAETCPSCNTDRYDADLAARGIKKARRQFNTFPIGPQIQARYRSPSGADDMGYRRDLMEDILAKLRANGHLDEIEDILHGSDFWDAYQRGHISPDDICLMFSMDGAQLYEHKASNCWIYIWILVDVSPDKRYKKKYVLMGAIIPGPNKPKYPDSYLFTGLYHVAALQREGLAVWDARRNVCFRARPWIFLVESDAVGAPELTGYVGHHGKKGCRNGCGRRGRRKPGAPHYYAVCLKPNEYHERGCEDEDYDPSTLPPLSSQQYEDDVKYLLGSTSMTNYEARRLETGLSKPSIFLGLSPSLRLSIPQLFPGDIMHADGLNITDLLQKLFRGTIDCDTRNGDNKSSWDWAVLVGETWKEHGGCVAAARQYMPGSFGRPPRNPAEKISSGYKCWEFLHWMYGMLPALLYGILPERFWRNFCKLVAGIRIIFQRHTTRKEREYAHQMIASFVYEFEKLYVQRKISRMHFLPQCFHAILHHAMDTERIGPLICSSQFTMERTIGDLGAEIRQPSDPFSNLAQRALRRAQVNGLKAILPELDRDQAGCTSSNVPICKLGDGYSLLHPREDRPRKVRPCEARAILQHFQITPDTPGYDEDSVHVQRWARCSIPNGQVCRSAWKEIPNKVSRISRNVKFRTRSTFRYGEVLYYFRIEAEARGANIGAIAHTLALVVQYSLPDSALLEASSGVLWACRAGDDDSIAVIDVKDIVACSAMIPFAPPTGFADTNKLYYAMNKLGVDMDLLSGIASDDPEDEQQA